MKGVSWNEAWGMSFSQRERIIKVINKRLKESSGDTNTYM